VGVAEAEMRQVAEAGKSPVVGKRHARPVLLFGAVHVPGTAQGPLPAHDDRKLSILGFLRQIDSVSPVIERWQDDAAWP